MSTEAPKRKKNASKKNKKSWRKNVDIDDVEEFLEDERLEQRIGGKFDDRKDEELFIVDNAVQKEDGAEKIPDRLQRRKAKAQKPLKCFQHLEITTGVPDPITKRNRVRSREERKNPTVVKKEEEMKRKGIKK
jgi:nucleolar protein 53